MRNSSPGRTGRGQRNSSAPAPTMPPAGLRSLSTSSRMVMAAVCQPLAASPLEYRVARGFLVEMERLGIELGAECLDSLLVDPHPAGAKGLPDGKVFEESPNHAH